MFLLYFLDNQKVQLQMQELNEAFAKMVAEVQKGNGRFEVSTPPEEA